MMAGRFAAPPIVRHGATLAVLLAGVALAVVLLQSGGSPYVVKMVLSDANGLRQGSPVAIAGQDVGTIAMNVRRGRVVVSMTLDRAQAPVGRDATASVASINLLGQKRIELTRGDVNDPAPSGYVLPASQVTVTTDLDQVLDVLTPDVRTRLGILINAAGQAFTGRRADFSHMLEQLPSDFNAGTELLSGIAADNHTLADLVRSSDGFIGQLAAQRAQLMHAVTVLGQASSTVQARRAQLAMTLARAPATLSTLQAFLVKLQSTTVPLGPAARYITDAAPELNATLAQLDPFRRAADPTLVEATRVAPALTRLATGATPVVRRATPVVTQLATFSAALAAISQIVNKSADNLVATLQNWARAIQLRDGLSHVFRGEASITPQILWSMVNQLQQSGLLGSFERATARFTSGSRAGKTPVRRPGRARRAQASGLRRPERTSSANSTTVPFTPPSGGGSLASLLSYLLAP